MLNNNTTPSDKELIKFYENATREERRKQALFNTFQEMAQCTRSHPSRNR